MVTKTLGTGKVDDESWPHRGTMELREHSASQERRWRQGDMYYAGGVTGPVEERWIKVVGNRIEAVGS
jgi:hypothetical protein